MPDVRTPLMIALAEEIRADPSYSPSLGAMTKYKTYTGDEIDGQKVWNYDYHADDD